MAAAHVLTGGFGNGSLAGLSSLVLSLGYGTGAEAVVVYAATCGPRSVVKPGTLSIVKQYLRTTKPGQLGKDCCCG